MRQLNGNSVSTAYIPFSMLFHIKHWRCRERSDEQSNSPGILLARCDVNYLKKKAVKTALMK
jgi:hypothetical protein